MQQRGLDAGQGRHAWAGGSVLSSTNTAAAFDRQTLELIDTEREVEIETVRLDGTRIRTVIWAVVDDGNVYVRSYRGDGAYWYQSAVEAPDEVALQVDGRAVLVRAVRAIDELSIAACSRGLEAKYAGDPAMQSMLRPNVLETTLRLEPR